MSAAARLQPVLPEDIKPEHFMRLPAGARQEFGALMEALNRTGAQRQFFDLFPDNDNIRDGKIIHSRRWYPKHLELFRAGAKYRERCFLAANRVGKTVAGGYETTAHLTGLYPEWWQGKRFDGPIEAWACGKNNETTREIVQAALLGNVSYEGGARGFKGNAMVPAYLMGRKTWKRGVEDLIDTIQVKHVTGGWSRLAFKSYEQGRGSFEGTARHWIWLDEECPVDIYGECLIRTATTNGSVLLTFTPLEGLTETVMQFIERPA